MKRTVTCLLAVCIMAMTSFTAFAEIPRVTEETKEFTFWAAYNPNYQTDWENIKAWQYFEEATGVHVNWELYANSGEMAEKLNVLIASGDLSSFPDAFYRCGISASQLKRYGPEGLFLDIYDLVQQYAPNLCARMDETNAWRVVLDPVTNAMYSCPDLSNSVSARMHPKLFLNTKMMQAVGVDKMPETTDELYDLLVLIRDQDANGNGDATDEIGITSNYASNVIRAFTGAFGIDNRGRDDLSVDADPADETKVRFVYTTDEYRSMLSYLNRLYEENLLDHDLFGVNTGNMIAKGSQDMIFGLSYTNIVAAGVDETDYRGLEVALKGPEGHQDWNNLSAGIGVGSFVISASCEDPETLVKWIDSFYSEEGSLMLHFGKEGVDFTYDENGYPVYTDQVLSQVSTDNPYDKVISAITPYASGGLPRYMDDKTFCGSECRGEALAAAQRMEPYANEECWMFNFTTDEEEELSALRSDLITNCHDVYQAKFITGELDVDDDAVWDGYVAEMEGMGLEDYLYIYQTALDRMLAME